MILNSIMQIFYVCTDDRLVLYLNRQWGEQVVWLFMSKVTCSTMSYNFIVHTVMVWHWLFRKKVVCYSCHSVSLTKCNFQNDLNSLQRQQIQIDSTYTIFLGDFKSINQLQLQQLCEIPSLITSRSGPFIHIAVYICTQGIC